MRFSLNNVIDFRRESRERSDEIAREDALRAANEAQRKALLDTAPIRDLDDLVPVLSARVAITKAAYDKALQEYADTLAEIDRRKRY